LRRTPPLSPRSRMSCARSSAPVSMSEDGGRTPPDCKVLVSLLVARVGRIREALTMPAAVGRVRWNRAAGERCVRCARRDEMSYARRLRRPRRVSG
jgi:hypothetical protein